MATLTSQTFTIDIDSVKGAQQVNISSIDLYFKSKPYKVGNSTGVIEPGVNIYVVPTAAGGIPNFTTLDNYAVARKEYSEIVSSLDATVVTNFKFVSPITVNTGSEYAIVIKTDNGEVFDLWAFTQGETNVANKTRATGLAGKFTGQYFQLSNVSNTWQPLPYKNLKFAVYIAKYIETSSLNVTEADSTITLHMNNYEFVTYNEIASSGTLFGGELVYQDNTTPLGQCSVIKGQNYAKITTGTFGGGKFLTTSDPSYIVVKDNYGTDVRQVIYVSGDGTSITVDKPFSITNTSADFIKSPVAKAYVSRKSSLVNSHNALIVLANSSASNSSHFSNNTVLRGEVSGAIIANAYFNDILVHSSDPHVYVHAPPGTSFTTMQVFDYTSNDDVTGVLFAGGELNYPVTMFAPTNLDVGTPVMIKSRSNEVTYRNILASGNNSSSRIDVVVKNTGQYVSPQVDLNSTDVFFTRYVINDDATGENTNSGNALSKHITTKINFDKNRQAEDIAVYLDAYKPAGTDVLVYAKIFNNNDSDYYDDKDWSLLQETSGNRHSSMTNLSDFVEYTYSFRPYPDTLYTLAGSSTITAGSANVVGTSTNYRDIATITGWKIVGGSTQITTTNTTSALSTGMLISGYGIDVNTTVTNISVVSGITTITMSRRAIIGSTGTSLDFKKGLLAGDLVKIYEPLFPNNYVIAAVSSVSNSTSFTLGTTITTDDVSRTGGSGLLVDKIEYPHQAFLNLGNSNTVRYYNSNLAAFDKYDTFALKIVFQSNSQFVIPKVKDIRAIGVSA
jgi:hypothetical protein